VITDILPPCTSNGSIELPGSSEKTRLEDEQNLRDLEAAHGIAAAGQSDGAPPTRAAAGWRPWKVMIGCFCLTVPTYGLLSSIGLFQTYWHQHMLQGYSESEISWIISVFGFLTCLFASPAGIVFDRYGSAWLLPTGSVAYIVSFIGLTFSSTYQELMGCMTLAGLAAGR
jgi:predicted MFS family arabinose efflux permease